ncbi:MAG: hypothetical protein R6U51_07735 [Anaerolineales bacterium]
MFQIVAGVEHGALVIEILQAKGIIDLANVVVCITISVCNSIFTCWESIKALQIVRTDPIKLSVLVIGDRSLVSKDKAWHKVMDV